LSTIKSAAISPILLAMRFAHVGISVANQVCSRRFYEGHFGFDPDQARSHPDGSPSRPTAPRRFEGGSSSPSSGMIATASISTSAPRRSCPAVENDRDGGAVIAPHLSRRRISSLCGDSMNEVDVELDDVLGTGARGSKHVLHSLRGLRLNAVEQLSGAIGAELATNIEHPGSRSDHALHERRVAVEYFKVPC
jgi:hypothetical protein